MKKIVISAVNLRSGGTLSILKDCLSFLEMKHSGYKVVALVHKKEMFNEFKKIEFIEYPKSASSYFYRIFLEYFHFKRISREIKPQLWFSLHDMTPNVHADRRVVYCHNATPFYKTSLKEVYLDPKFFF